MTKLIIGAWPKLYPFPEVGNTGAIVLSNIKNELEKVAVRVLRKATEQEYVECVKENKGKLAGYDMEGVEYFEVEILD